jgi:6-phospho-beta-glucosidase
MPLLSQRARFQMLAAQAAWSGDRLDAVAAMAAHPLVGEAQAEALYDEMAAAQAKYLPPRLLKPAI